MTEASKHDAWSAGEAYHNYMGRWSWPVAREFLRWIGAPERADWLDVGCGSGALTAAILADCGPRSVVGIDPSEGFVAYAAAQTKDARARFQRGDAMALPFEDASFDVAASGLVLNFVPDPAKGLSEMARVVRPGGLVAFYVWDYPGGGMGFIDAFWRAAARVDPNSADLNESKRFPDFTRDGVVALCAKAGLGGAEVTAIETVTRFDDFEAFWRPFTLGAGPAPGYAKSLSEDRRAALKAELARALGSDGPVSLPARAWAARVDRP